MAAKTADEKEKKCHTDVNEMSSRNQDEGWVWEKRNQDGRSWSKMAHRDLLRVRESKMACALKKGEAKMAYVWKTTGFLNNFYFLILSKIANRLKKER